MGKYYLGGLGLGIVLFIIMSIIGGIGNCSYRSQEQDRVKDMESNYVVIRFYEDLGTTNSSGTYVNHGEISVIRVRKGSQFTISSDKLPQKQGMIFAGLYDTPTYVDGLSQQYVDQFGESVLEVWEDVVLYALYTA